MHPAVLALVLVDAAWRLASRTPRLPLIIEDFFDDFFEDFFLLVLCLRCLVVVLITFLATFFFGVVTTLREVVFFVVVVGFFEVVVCFFDVVVVCFFVVVVVVVVVVLDVVLVETALTVDAALVVVVDVETEVDGLTALEARADSEDLTPLDLIEETVGELFAADEGRTLADEATPDVLAVDAALVVTTIVPVAEAEAAPDVVVDTASLVVVTDTADPLVENASALSSVVKD